MSGVFGLAQRYPCVCIADRVGVSPPAAKAALSKIMPRKSTSVTTYREDNAQKILHGGARARRGVPPALSVVMLAWSFCHGERSDRWKG